MNNDIINHPAHYTQGIECIDYIESHKMDFVEGAIVKYITRYKDKNGLEDLRKARWFLDRLISRYENTPVEWPSPEECAKPLGYDGEVLSDTQAFLREMEEQYRRELEGGIARAMNRHEAEQLELFPQEDLTVKSPPDYDIFEPPKYGWKYGD